MTRETADQRRKIFLAELAAHGRVATACRAAGLDRSDTYKTKDRDPEFAKQWDDALELFIDSLEGAARLRAVEGLDEPLSHQGQLSYEFQRNPDGSVKKDESGFPLLVLDAQGRPKPVTVKKYSDSLLALMLKAKRKREYGDASKVELTGADGGALKVEESPTAIGRKIAFALAVAMRAKEQEAPVIPDDGSDMA